jgi:hypothetical protein
MSESSENFIEMEMKKKNLPAALRSARKNFDS